MSEEEKTKAMLKYNGYFERVDADHSENRYEWFDHRGNRIASHPKSDFAADNAYRYARIRSDWRYIGEYEEEAAREDLPQVQQPIQPLAELHAEIERLNAVIAALGKDKGKLYNDAVMAEYEANQRITKLEADLAAAKDIIVQAGEKVAGLEAEKVELRDSLRRMVNQVLDGAFPHEIERTARYFLDKLDDTQAPAPLAESVTLSEDAINYLAPMWTTDGTIVSIFEIKAPFHSIVTHWKQKNMFELYRLDSFYDTPANRAAIEARRKATSEAQS